MWQKSQTVFVFYTLGQPDVGHRLKLVLVDRIVYVLDRLENAQIFTRNRSLLMARVIVWRLVLLLVHRRVNVVNCWVLRVDTRLCINDSFDQGIHLAKLHEVVAAAFTLSLHLF